jgi:hypothetical protein
MCTVALQNAGQQAAIVHRIPLPAQQRSLLACNVQRYRWRRPAFFAGR